MTPKCTCGQPGCKTCYERAKMRRYRHRVQRAKSETMPDPEPTSGALSSTLDPRRYGYQINIRRDYV